MSDGMLLPLQKPKHVLPKGELMLNIIWSSKLY